MWPTLLLRLADWIYQPEICDSGLTLIIALPTVDFQQFVVYCRFWPFGKSKRAQRNETAPMFEAPFRRT